MSAAKVTEKPITWTELNNQLRVANEEDCNTLLTTYTAHGNRPLFRLRIYQRLNLMRKRRELKELGLDQISTTVEEGGRTCTEAEQAKEEVTQVVHAEGHHA